MNRIKKVHLKAGKRMRGVLVQVNSQTIHLVHVHPAGQLIPLHIIGQHCFPDDDLILSHQVEQEAAWRQQHQVSTWGLQGTVRLLAQLPVPWVDQPLFCKLKCWLAHWQPGLRTVCRQQWISEGSERQTCANTSCRSAECRNKETGHAGLSASA